MHENWDSDLGSTPGLTSSRMCLWTSSDRSGLLAILALNMSPILARSSFCLCSWRAGEVLGEGRMPWATRAVIGRRTISFTFKAASRWTKILIKISWNFKIVTEQFYGILVEVYNLLKKSGERRTDSFALFFCISDRQHPRCLVKETPDPNINISSRTWRSLAVYIHIRC